jgi:hypothetical protein
MMGYIIVVCFVVALVTLFQVLKTVNEQEIMHNKNKALALIISAYVANMVALMLYGLSYTAD